MGAGGCCLQVKEESFSGGVILGGRLRCDCHQRVIEVVRQMDRARSCRYCFFYLLFFKKSMIPFDSYD
jgi:hypothetical protein